MKKFCVLFVIFAFALISYSCKDNAVSGSESGNSPFQGNWKLNISNGMSFTITVAKAGTFDKTSNGVNVKGGVQDDGNITGTFTDSNANSNGNFTGKFSGSHGTGTWTSSNGDSGTWSATEI